jgi:hypothetical protein
MHEASARRGAEQRKRFKQQKAFVFPAKSAN